MLNFDSRCPVSEVGVDLTMSTRNSLLARLTAELSDLATDRTTACLGQATVCSVSRIMLLAFDERFAPAMGIISVVYAPREIWIANFHYPLYQQSTQDHVATSNDQ